MVRYENKVSVFHGIPVLIPNLEFDKLILMFNKVVVETLKRIVLINIDIGINRFFKQSDFLFDPEICVMLADKGIFSFPNQVLYFQIKHFVRISLSGRHPSDDGFLRADVKGPE